MRIIIDTCFWIALYNPEKHIDISDDINFITEFIEDHEIIIPYPSLYEFLNSKFSRKNDALHFQKLLSKPNYIKLDDNPYKDVALYSFFEKAINEYNDVSFVDEIIKEIISTEPYKIDYLISFDEGLNNYARSIGISVYK
jgi:hypothetical protein